jgi:hypothetical protein
MEDIYAELRELSQEQRELMLSMLEKEGVDLARLPLPERRLDASAPMSMAQQRLWTMHQLSSGMPTENVPVAIELDGELDVKALSAGLSLLVERHEILRTTFHEGDAVPEQHINAFSPAELALVDLSGPHGEPGENVVEAALVKEGSRLFHPERDWLLRPVIFRLATDKHILLLTFHQLVVDGWAINVLLQELSAAYASFCAGATPDVDAPAVQYADMAEWEQDGWEAERIAAQAGIWAEKLAGAPALLEVPTGRVRPAVPAFSGAIALLFMSAEPVAALRDLARQEGVTLFTAVLTTLKVLLAEYSGSTDILVGTLISRRSRAETENMVGNFGNNLLLRSEISPAASFRETLHRVNDVTLDAMSIQDAPLELVNSSLQKATGKRIPAFQIGFIFRDGGLQDRLKMSGLQVRQRFVDLGTARLDLWLDLADHGATLSGEVQYRTDLFDAAQMERLMLHWERAANQLTQYPDLPLAEISLFTAEDGLSQKQGAEIATLLAQHPDLVDVDVAVPGPLAGGQTTISFVLADSSAITGSELRDWLTERLEFELGPAFFKESDAFSINAAANAGVSVDSSISESLTEFETMISDVWKQELGVRQVYANDNFFDLGGPSLLAIDVLKQLRNLGDSPPDPKSLVTGTLRQLARQMQGNAPGVENAPTTAVETKPQPRGFLARLAARLS